MFGGGMHTKCNGACQERRKRACKAEWIFHEVLAEKQSNERINNPVVTNE
jgi:hypothetical protein